jgi:hypothetical protein
LVEETRRARAERQKRRLTVVFAGFILLTLIAGGVAFNRWKSTRLEQRLAYENRASATEEELTQVEGLSAP